MQQAGFRASCFKSYLYLWNVRNFSGGELGWLTGGGAWGREGKAIALLGPQGH